MLMAQRFAAPSIVRTGPRHRVRRCGDTTFRGWILQEGLYKAEFHTVHGAGTGVIYAAGGKLRGGNSAFAFIGNYTDKGDGIDAEGRR